MSRGILATCTARTAPGVPADVLRDALHAAYDDEPFVHVLAAGSAAAHGCDATAPTACTCRSPLDPHSGRTTVLAAEDNLVKGAAGQALQNANRILGLPETLGLPVNGVAP